MPSMMRRLTSAPKPSWRVRVYMSSRSVGVLGAQPVAHAVEAREVRGGLGRREHVVGRERVRRVRQVHLARSRRRARSARASAAWKASSTPASIPSPVSSSGTPRRTPSRRSALGSAISSGKLRARSRRRRRGRPCGASISAASAHVARQRPGLVERGGEGDHPVARDGAVGRFQPDDPAQRRGLADRAAGVGAERPRREPGGDRGGAAAGGAAGHALAVPRVAHRPEGGVLVRGAHRELVLVGLRRAASRRRRQARDDGRGVRRQVALEDPRAGLAGHALGAEQVLDRQRHAAERRPRRAVPRAPVGDPGEAVQALLAGRPVGGGAGAVGLEQLPRRERPGGDRRRRPALADSPRTSVALMPAGSGPGNPPSLTAGACARATSRGSDGRGSSARSAPVDLDDVRGRRDVVEVELADLARRGRARPRARAPSARSPPRSAPGAPAAPRAEPRRGRSQSTAF